MNTSSIIPWEKVYDFTLSCSYACTPKDFAVEIVSQMRNFCRFDKSLVYFMDGNHHICDQYLMNIDKDWSSLYIEYYSKTSFGYFNNIESYREIPYTPKIYQIDWKKEPKNDFTLNYIVAENLKFSLGFFLYDINGEPMTLIAFDNTRSNNFSDNEVLFLYTVFPLLNNLHKKFFYKRGYSQVVEKGLTDREKEIVDLLCQGVSPTNISKILYISPATTYKHIQNIYRKLQVSSIQELLARYKIGVVP